MAIGYKSAGGGVSTETSGAALSPLCPATVDAGDIMLAHVFWEGTTTAPSTPSGWDLLNPGGTAFLIETTVARHWVFGRIADGTEDGAAVAFGSPAVTTQRAARIYSFSGRVAGTILQLAGGVTHLSHATDPAMPTVTTPATGALAVALMAQNDNNTSGNATGESGGDWVEAVAEYVAALTPGLQLQIQTCIPTANPGTVSGGTVATTNDPCGVIGLWLRDNVAAVAADAGSGSYSVSGVGATSTAQRSSNAEAGSVSITGSSASEGIGSGAGAGVISVSGADATGDHETAFTNTDSNAEFGAVAVSGADAAATVALNSNAEPGAITVTGSGAAAVVAVLGRADAGSVAVSGADAAASRAIPSNAEPSSYAHTGADAVGTYEDNPAAHTSNAGPGSYGVSGRPTYSGSSGEDDEETIVGSSGAPMKYVRSKYQKMRNGFMINTEALRKLEEQERSKLSTAMARLTEEDY